MRQKGNLERSIYEIGKNSGGGYKFYDLIFLLTAITITIGACFARRPFEGEGFAMSDATYHVLLTMQAYDETEPSIHHYLPIQTYGNRENKYINNGPSLIPDEYGNSYYVSFSPIGFYMPYFFCKILSLPLTAGSLFIFNSILFVISGALIGSITFFIFEKKEIAYPIAFIYMAMSEVLYTQGIVYWHHSLSQVFLLIQMLSFIKILKLRT